jgi:3-hydroxypropionyl-CoA synthetase (ADP-forming)
MLSINDLQKKYDISIARSTLIKDRSSLRDELASLRLPIALKIESADILHKSDIGGVSLNISSIEDAYSEYDKIISSVGKNCPDAKIEGVLAQEMAPEGIETIIGYEDNEQFGPTIMFGMGGIFTELFKDISFRLLPIEKKDALQMVRDLRFSDILLKGYRNIKAPSIDALAGLLLKVSEMALDLKDEVSSFDINPALLYEDGYKVIDFKYVPKRPGKKSSAQEKINTADIGKFFDAASVAHIGASEIPGKIGTLILDSLKNHGYKGKIFPINPKYDKVMGLAAYKSLLDIQEPVDLLVISISLERVPDILRDADRKGIKSVIIISAGGKEIGNDQIEERIRQDGKKLGIRIIGCNCLGVVNGHSRLDTLFTPYETMERPPAGSISFVTQSGTVGISFLELLDRYGLSKFSSYGNRIDVDEGDLISYLKEDDKTSVISMYIEGLEKGRKFFEAARDASAKKPVLVYKAGRSPEASKAASSHTGFLSGTYSMIKGVMDQAGIISVDSFEGLLSSAKALSRYGRANGSRVMAITNGAGAMIQALDRIDRNKKLTLARLSIDSVNMLKEALPAHATISNPIDISGSSLDEHYDLSVEASVNDPNVDIVIVWFVFQVKTVTKGMADILSKHLKAGKPIICGAFGRGHTYDMGRLIEDKGIPIFYSIEETVSAAESISG